MDYKNILDTICMYIYNIYYYTKFQQPATNLYTDCNTL
jgi:hypothetical protein